MRKRDETPWSRVRGQGGRPARAREGEGLRERGLQEACASLQANYPPFADWEKGKGPRLLKVQVH